MMHFGSQFLEPEMGNIFPITNMLRMIDHSRLIEQTETKGTISG